MNPILATMMFLYDFASQEEDEYQKNKALDRDVDAFIEQEAR